MTKHLFAIVAALVLSQAFAAELTWLTDVDKAVKRAATEKKLVLLDFTGSDWCGWCKKLDADVWQTAEFATYAKKNLVLVELDFPRTKPLPEELKKANAALRDKYQVKGYPTLVFLNGKGQKVGEHVGYLKGGPKAMIEKIDGFRGK
jgi:thioredoxin-related protein